MQVCVRAIQITQLWQIWSVFDVLKIKQQGNLLRCEYEMHRLAFERMLILYSSYKRTSDTTAHTSERYTGITSRWDYTYQKLTAMIFATSKLHESVPTCCYYELNFQIWLVAVNASLSKVSYAVRLRMHLAKVGYRLWKGKQARTMTQWDEQWHSGKQISTRCHQDSLIHSKKHCIPAFLQLHVGSRKITIGLNF